MPNSNNDTYGKLLVKVTSGRDTIPLENALVLIRPYDDEESDILYSLRTDEDGMTKAVDLKAPPKSISFIPGGDAKPFSQYIITVKADGYYTVENIGVPIFDGITSIQNVEMIPLTEVDMFSGISPEVTYFQNEEYENLRGTGDRQSNIN